MKQNHPFALEISHVYLWQCLHDSIQQSSHPCCHLQKLQHCRGTKKQSEIASCYCWFQLALYTTEFIMAQHGTILADFLLYKARRHLQQHYL